MKAELVHEENCSYGEPDCARLIADFAFRRIRFIFVCEDMAFRLGLVW